MIIEETIKILKKISDECDCRSKKAFKNHVPIPCEECPYYLPNMPDEEECLFDHRPCVWGDYLKMIIGRNEESED